MLGFGMFIGLSFPFVVILLDVPRNIALRPSFFAATLVAGLVVAEVNHLLARAVVGVRLRSLAGGMQRVEVLLDATRAGDWADCDPAMCMVPVDSADELGDVAASFNALVTGLSSSHRVSDGITMLSKALAAHLELDALAESALGELSIRTGCDAAGLLVVTNGRVHVAGSSGIRDVEQLASAEAVLTALRTAQPTVLHLPPDVVVSGSLVDFIPQEVQVLPVSYGVATVGVLLVAFAQPSSPETRAVLSATLPGLAVAVNNALNHEALQRVAALDPLTGVFNRRFGLQRLTEEFARSLRSGDPLGVLMLDLDHFKAVTTPTDISSATACCKPWCDPPGRYCVAGTCCCATEARSSSSSCPVRGQRIWRRWPNGSGTRAQRRTSPRPVSASRSPRASVVPACPTPRSPTRKS